MNSSISLVIPVHNEEKIISANLSVLVSYMASEENVFSIVLVENGSSDSTLELAREYASKDSRVIAYTIDKKSLGDALREGFLKAPGEILIWYPIDLSVDLSYITHSLELIKTSDIVIGSKDMKGSRDDRSGSRRLYSKFYNTLVNLLFNLHISDTQCVKTFRKESLVPLVNAAKSGGIVFEVELLYLAKKKGLCVKEIPVTVIDRRADSKIKFKDIRKAFTDLLALRLRV